MATQLVGMYVILMLLWSPSFADAQQCNKQTSSIYGKALVNHVYLRINSRDLKDCVISCAQEHVQKCRSTNWDLATNICELNNGTYEDHANDLVKKTSFIYMTSIASVIPIVNEAVSEPKVEPGKFKSCKDILDKGKSKGDGEYLIDPENTGSPFKVYCDMSTGGGGWILIKNRTLVEPITPITVQKSNNYRDISKRNQLNLYISITALNKLRTVIGARQLRWYCQKKKNANRIFHVMTKTDETGTKVFEYFTDSSKTYRTACDSFSTLPGDNSELSKNCNSWGYEGNQPRQNKWSWTVYNDMRIFRTVARWESNYAFGMYDNEYSCDDHASSASDTVTTGDKWMVYIR